MYALVELQVSETISVGEVTLHESEESAIAAGREKYDSPDCEEDDYGRYVDPESGDAIFQVVPIQA